MQQSLQYYTYPEVRTDATRMAAPMKVFISSCLSGVVGSGYLDIWLLNDVNLHFFCWLRKVIYIYVTMPELKLK